MSGFSPPVEPLSQLYCTRLHLERGKDVTMVFFDLRKAFGSVSSLTSIGEAERSGGICVHTAVGCINRQQRVVVNQHSPPFV